MKKALLPFMLHAMLATQENYEYDEMLGDTHFDKCRSSQEIIPKGAKKYWFREDGTFVNSDSNERMLKEDVVFSCYAIKDANATKKFEKFKSQNR